MRERDDRPDRLKLHSRMNRANMTLEERIIWYDYLRHLRYTVRRQHVFEKYIADFYIPAVGLVIELDGSQHYTSDGLKYDAIRDDFLTRHGLKVIRIKNERIRNDFAGVVDEIEAEIREREKTR